MVGEELIGFEEAHEFGGGVGEAGATAGKDVEVAGDVQFLNLDFLEPAVLNLPINAHARDDGDAHAHLNETLDALDCGHFHGHVEGRAMAREELDDAAAEGRFDDMGDERFLAEFFDADLSALGERMLGGNDKSKFVFQDFGGLELRVTGDEGDGAEVKTIVHDFMGNVAGKHAMEADLNAGMGFAEFRERREQGMDGTFVDAEGEFAALEALELHETFLDLVAEVEEAFGVFAEERAGIGEADWAGPANEEGLAEGVLEFADGEADGGLGAVQALGSAGEAAFASDGEEDL